jgi:hypothetical protein
MILGTLFIMLWLIIFKILIYGLTTCCCFKNYKCCLKISGKVSDGLFWNEIIDYMMSSYAEILFGLLLQSNNVNWDDRKDFLTNIIFFLFMTGAVFLPFWISIYFTKRYKLLMKDTYIERFGELYENIKIGENDYGIYRPVTFLLRRLAMVVSIYYLMNYNSIFSIWALQLNQTVHACFNLQVKPFKDSKMYRDEIFDDLTIVLATWNLLKFIDPEEDPHVRYSYGWSLIVLYSINVSIRITFVLITIVKSLILKGKQILNKCKARGCCYCKKEDEAPSPEAVPESIVPMAQERRTLFEI